MKKLLYSPASLRRSAKPKGRRTFNVVANTGNRVSKVSWLWFGSVSCSCHPNGLCPVGILSPVRAINPHSHVQAACENIQEEQTQAEMCRLLQISPASLCILTLTVILCWF